MTPYQEFFGFKAEPFSQRVELSDLYPLPDLSALVDRFEYCIHLGACGVVTGEIGSGKSTSLRFAASKLHPSEYKTILLVANSGTFSELVKQFSLSLGTQVSAHSITKLMNAARELITEVTSRKQTPILIIDEAHLVRQEVFYQLHTLAQYEYDSKPLLPIILCGQTQLLDKLSAIQSRPLASRVVVKTHLEALTLEDMKGYLKHHLEIAGVKNQIFNDNALLAIHQGSGGFLRRANTLARGAIVAATKDKSLEVTAEYVRIASTEIL